MSGGPARVLVILDVPPAFEEDVTDWLRERDDGLRFNVYAARAHGRHVGPLSVEEQVRGYQARAEFRIPLLESTLEGFLADFEPAFAAADLRVLVLPILR